MGLDDAMATVDPPRSAWRHLITQIKLERGSEDSRCCGYPSGYPRVVRSQTGRREALRDLPGARRRLRIGKHVRPAGTGGSEEVLRKITLTDIVAEIEKCDVVCKNCHEVRNTERLLESRIGGVEVSDAGALP